jgi:PKD repeat protein
MWVDYNPDVFVQWKPNGDTGGIYYGDVGQEIIFDASGSFDHEGEIISYEWDFGDGSSGYGEITSKVYDSEGVYYVTLNVIDNEGNIDNDTTWAFIGRSNDPPNTPTIKGPSKIKKNIEYTYTFTAIDPDGDDIYYTIFWGDYDPPLFWIGPFSSGKDISLSHTWIDKAAYYIHVKAKDRFDFESDWETLSVTMPKNKSNNFNLETLNWIFEHFSNTFPILKHLLRLTFLEV